MRAAARRPVDALRGAARLLGAALLLATATARADAPAIRPEGAPMFVIPLHFEGSAPLPADASLRLVLRSSDVSRLARVLRAAPPAAGATALDYTLAEYPALESATARTWLEPTWVIDFDEPAVAELQRALEATRGAPDAAAPGAPTRTPAPITPEAIVDFVADTVRESYDQGLEIASVVARRRTGDCTEHAVLTAALARASGIPARVVFGVALVETPTGYAAYGHAWAELRSGDRWRVADAALVGLPHPPRYVPFGLMEDEGPGYVMGLATFIPSWISRVDVLGVAAGQPVPRSPPRGP